MNEDVSRSSFLVEQEGGNAQALSRALSMLIPLATLLLLQSQLLNVIATNATGELLVFNTHVVEGYDIVNNFMQLYASDLEGDGDMDVFVVDYDLGVVLVENDGALLVAREGFFDSRSFPRNFAGETAVAVADLDGDGDMDVVVATDGDARLGSVGWYEMMDSQTAFRIHIAADGVASFLSVEVADLDGDGDVDIVCGPNDDSFLLWLENNGSGNFSIHEQTTSNAGFVLRVAVEDMDGDNDSDIVLAGYSGITWHENVGVVTFTEHLVYPDRANDVHIVDMNNDFDLDIVVPAFDDEEIVWLENKGTANFSIAPRHSVAITGESFMMLTAVVDFDGDGDQDIVYASNDELTWFENNITDKFQRHRLSEDFGAYDEMLVVDVDGDNDFDILVGGAQGNILWYEIADSSKTFPPSLSPTGWPSRAPTQPPSHSPSAYPTSNPTMAPSFPVTPQSVTVHVKTTANSRYQRLIALLLGAVVVLLACILVTLWTRDCPRSRQTGRAAHAVHPGPVHT